ncbi:heme peroxidase [Gymnopilus junonius]|uniref:Peroxidase n=1 Tax=Gymnopilus junonius TaxID=109634 RepID=A0A9P5NK91_GYMJU|nr:heme peroxidase [Gymnopilus junonius]
MVLGRLAMFVALFASQLGNAAVVKRSELFDGGECGEEAHAALRLAFHDAIGFSTSGTGGGADGSILAFNSTELAYVIRFESRTTSIDDIIARQWPVFTKTNLTAGDFLHLAAAVGVANCPGSPQLPYSFGHSVTDILARMADAGFVAAEVVWLLASHSIGDANKIDPSIPGTPFDSCVNTLSHCSDTQFFLEVLLQGTAFPGNGGQSGEVLSPLAGEMRLQSDFAFSQDSRTACFWQEAVNAQSFIMGKFEAAMAKMQLLGQSGLTDCSDVIPVPATFTNNIQYPASFNQSNVQIACTTTPFPSLATVAGPAPTVSPVPQS